MRRKRDEGNATLEFIAAAVLLMVPLVYGIVSLAQLERAVFGVSGAAQMAARAYANSNTDAVGRFAAWRSASIAGRNHGLFIATDRVRVECGAADCLVPGTRVRVTVETSQRIGVAVFARTVPLRASHAFVIDSFRQAAP